MKDRSIECNWWDYENKRNNQFYSGNILSDVEYQENKVKDFFDNNKEIFETLANAHIEKMNFN